MDEEKKIPSCSNSALYDVDLLKNIFKIGQKTCKNTTIKKQNIDLLRIKWAKNQNKITHRL